MKKTLPTDLPRPDDFIDLLNRFPEKDRDAVLARAFSLRPNTIAKMRLRGRVGPAHWDRLQKAAAAENILISDGDLARAEKLFQRAKRNLEPELDLGGVQ